MMNKTFTVQFPVTVDDVVSEEEIAGYISDVISCGIDSMIGDSETRLDGIIGKVTVSLHE